MTGVREARDRLFQRVFAGAYTRANHRLQEGRYDHRRAQVARTEHDDPLDSAQSLDELADRAGKARQRFPVNDVVGPDRYRGEALVARGPLQREAASPRPGHRRDAADHAPVRRQAAGHPPRERALHGRDSEPAADAVAEHAEDDRLRGVGTEEILARVARRALAPFLGAADRVEDLDEHATSMAPPSWSRNDGLVKMLERNLLSAAAEGSAGR